MRRSESRILTTHVGALPAPVDIWGRKDVPEDKLTEAVAEVIRLQRDSGVDIVNEGELTKGGNWVTFINSRLSGYTPVDTGDLRRVLLGSPDWEEYGDYYQSAMANGTLFEHTAKAPNQTQGGTRDFVCEGPIEYTGTGELQKELRVARAALGDIEAADMFITSTAPASLEPGRVNRYYRNDEDYLFALADAMRVEYEAIVDAGFIVQVDDAWLAALWDRIGIPMGIEAYRKYARLRMDALNHGLRNIPPEKVRYHMCWGSWHGPHSYDLPLADIVDILLKVNAQTYLIEGANVRHEHEYAVWDKVKLPDGKLLAPGVVSHATTLIEHPQLVAERLCRYATRVGRENVIASTDCGLGLRCHPQIAWGKLRTLSEGARIASEKLW